MMTETNVVRIRFDIGTVTLDAELLDTPTAQAIAAVRTSEEGQEGLRAFLEKRRAAWRQDVDSGPPGK